MAEFERVGVIGLGLMGAGIAEVCARAGLDVVGVEADDAAVDRGQQRLEASLARGVRANKLTDSERDEALSRVHVGTDLASFADRQLVIEAAVEDEAVKQELFERLNRIVTDPRAVFASNTSTIPIVKMAMASGRPEQVIGVHFFNPAPVMSLVELTSTVRTSEETRLRVEVFVADTLNKSVIHSADRAGFIVNGLLIPYLLSAIRMLEARFATAEDIDLGMVMGCNHPLGPLALSDFIGLDTVRFCAESMYAEYKDPALATPPLLARMVDGGMLGRKSGRGFFEYS